MSSPRGKRFSHPSKQPEILSQFPHKPKLSETIISPATTLPYVSSQSSLTSGSRPSPLSNSNSLTLSFPPHDAGTGRPSLFRIFSAPASSSPTKPSFSIRPSSPVTSPPVLKQYKSAPHSLNKMGLPPETEYMAGDFSESDNDETTDYKLSKGDFSDEEILTQAKLTINNDEDLAIDMNFPEEKAHQPPSNTHIIIKCLQLLFAIIAASVNANNSFFGALRSSTLFFSFNPPKNLAELTKNGLGDVPVGITIFACLTAIASELVNIVQIYDFGGKAMDNVRKLLPLLEKLWRKESLTRKEIAILTGITLSLGAAAGAAKLAYDPTAKSPEWYFRNLWGILAANAFFSMTLITRSVNTQTAIENCSWFYANPDKTYVLRLFQKLAPHYTSLAQPFTIPQEFKEPIRKIKKNIEEIFIQYKIPPNNIEYTLVKFFSLQSHYKSPSHLNKLLNYLNKVPSYLNFSFAVAFALVGWLIYTDKLSSLVDSTDKAAQISWETFSTTFSIPHLLFFFGSAHVILDKIITSLSLGPKKALATLGLIAIVFPTCLGLLNIALDIELHKHTDYPMPKEGSTRGWAYAVFSLFDSFWANLGSVLTMITLKDFLKKLNESLAVNPFHQVALKIINEVPTLEEEQKKAKKECQYTPPTLPKSESKTDISSGHEKKVIPIKEQKKAKKECQYTPPNLPNSESKTDISSEHEKKVIPIKEQKKAERECQYTPPTLPNSESKTDISSGHEKKVIPINEEPAFNPPLKPFSETVKELKTHISDLTTAVTRQGFFKPPVSNPSRQPLLEQEGPKPRGCLSRILSRYGYSC